MLDWNTQALRQFEREQDKAERRMEDVQARQSDLLAGKYDFWDEDNFRAALDHVDLAQFIALAKEGKHAQATVFLIAAVENHWENRAQEQAELEVPGPANGM